MMQIFEINEEVRLKSGSPILKVTHIAGNFVQVSWGDQEEEIEAMALTSEYSDQNDSNLENNFQLGGTVVLKNRNQTPLMTICNIQDELIDVIWYDSETNSFKKEFQLDKNFLKLDEDQILGFRS